MQSVATRLALIAVLFALSACGTMASAGLSSEGPTFVGKPVDYLMAKKGAPLRQMTFPSGATVYVYEAHNLIGSTFCEASYFIRGNVVVGFSAHGMALTCGGSAGETN